MKVSTKGRYGLRILLDVALHQEDGPVALSDVSSRQAISHKYLWQVINPLKSAGFLTATRGVKGGYVLARSPDKISIRDIVDILEGPISLAGPSKHVDQGVVRTTRETWLEIENKLNAIMSSITLADLIKRHKERESRIGPTYVI